MIPLLPIQLLISCNNLEKLDEYKKVLLSYNFRKTLADKVACFGNYQTMLWFQKNGLTLNKCVLVSAAKRGDIELFEKIWTDIWNDDSLDCSGLEQLIYDAFEGAAQFGHLNLLKFADSKSMLPSLHQIGTSVFFQAASKNGHLKILEWFFYIYWKPTNVFHLHYKKAFSAAVSGNKMDVLVWLKSFLDERLWGAFVRVSVHPYVSIGARHGNTNLVMWLVDQGFHSDQNSASAAATAGSIDLLKFFRHLWSEHVYTKAAEKGHLSVLKWAREDAEQNYPWPEAKMFPAAAKCDNVELYQWLFDQNFPFEEEISFIGALKLGHFKFIKFARSHGSLFWNDALYYSLLERAAQVGDLETLKWSIAENTGATGTASIDFNWIASPVIIAAATGGHLHILEYLRTTNYILQYLELFYSIVAEVAARHGHVPLLEWASANATLHIWSYACFLAAIKGSQFKVLVWLKTHFPDPLMKSPHPMLMAAEVGNIEVFKWLRNNGMKWHPMTYEVAKNSFHVDIAEWAIKNGCPKDKNSSGRSSFKKAKRLELTEYVKEEETLQEEQIEEEGEMIVLQDGLGLVLGLENEEEDQEEDEDEEDAVDQLEEEEQENDLH
jgi:hypothetical protein